MPEPGHNLHLACTNSQEKRFTHGRQLNATFSNTHVLDSSACAKHAQGAGPTIIFGHSVPFVGIRLAMVVHKGHTNSVYSVAFSPDGKSVASGSNDYTVRMWNAHSSSSIGEPLRGHNHRVWSVSYSPLGNLIASGSDDCTIRLWDTNTGQQSGIMQGTHLFYSVAFSPNAKLIASASGVSSSPTAFAVQMWGVQRRKAVSNPFKGHTNPVWSVSFSSDGTRLVSGSSDKTIRVWDVERGVTIVEPLKGHTNVVRSASFSPNDAQIVSCSFDGTIRLWDARNGGLIGEPYQGHTGLVQSVAFSPRGTYVASGGDDHTVRPWDTRTGRQVDQFQEHNRGVTSVAFSPCGQYIASGSYDCRVIIRKVLGDESYPNDESAPRVVTSHMSIAQIFECLRRAGCVDLSLQMDSRQDTAMIASGGGFGDIWKGKLHNGANVAIKAWRTDGFEPCSYKTIKRAARELYLWSRMDHPHIHRLQGVILFRDQYLGMVSEWMDNGNLHQYLRRYPNADRYELCTHIASGLEYMHARSTVHGDLKALNVLVSANGIAMLSDFDFSVLLEASSLAFSASSNSRPGTIRWAAPEILLEEVHEKTMQTDIYALGMTMLEIFTGEAPYPNCRTDISVIRTVERGTLPTRPTELGEDEKSNMMWHLMSLCWNRNASERPSAAQVVNALVFHICVA
ncbi:unnamed protein product [Rhizoctonia solani]|uniref:Protein kinase domain-containing protein n=1 Tax=Rhizoctonia solani TaxID=456999 RepID=A0A8H3E075_9AGAM|nr:unnamed protein product [Rhizoctonia solani]